MLAISNNNKIKLWDTLTNTEINSLDTNMEKDIYKFCFSPDGNKLVVVFENIIKILEIPTLIEIATLQFYNNYLTTIYFLPNNSNKIIYLVDEGILNIYDIYSKEESNFFNNIDDNIMTCVCLSLDTIAVGYDNGTIKIFLLNDEMRCEYKMSLLGKTAAIYLLFFSLDSNILIAEYGGTIFQIWNINTGLNITTFLGIKFCNQDLYISPDNSKIVLLASKGRAKIFMLNNLNINIYPEIPDSTISVISKDGDKIATSLCNGTIKIWDIDTQNELNILDVNMNTIQVLCFQPTTETAMW